MKSKDPAFLFYPLNWLEGTAEMLPEEKGVFIDLLCHQHQKGSIPAETARLCRLVGMNEDDFLMIWQHIKDKFDQVDNRLVNKKLSQVSFDRANRAKKNKISGIFAVLIRKKIYDEDNVDNQLVNRIKRLFKVDDFLDVEEIKISECITIWFDNLYNQMVDGINTIPFASLKDKDTNENEDTNENKDEGEGINTINISFEEFWDLYDKKVGHRLRCEKKWKKLKDEVRERIMQTLPEWKKQYPDKQYQPHPETYLNGGRWNDILYPTNVSGSMNGHKAASVDKATAKQIADNEKLASITPASRKAGWELED